MQAGGRVRGTAGKSSGSQVMKTESLPAITNRGTRPCEGLRDRAGRGLRSRGAAFATRSATAERVDARLTARAGEDNAERNGAERYRPLLVRRHPLCLSRYADQGAALPLRELPSARLRPDRDLRLHTVGRTPLHCRRAENLCLFPGRAAHVL